MPINNTNHCVISASIANNDRLMCEQDSRENALKAYIAHGKQRILANREFAGLSFSDFACFVCAYIVHDKHLIDGVLKFIICHQPDAVSINQQNLKAHQAFLQTALDAFLDEHQHQIEKHFELDHQNDQMEAAALAAGF